MMMESAKLFCCFHAICISSISKIKNMRTILIQLNSNSLGDTIAIMPCVEYFMSKNIDNVLVKSNPRYNSLFKESYPNIKFYEEDFSPKNIDKSLTQQDFEDDM